MPARRNEFVYAKLGKFHNGYGPVSDQSNVTPAPRNTPIPRLADVSTLLVWAIADFNRQRPGAVDPLFTVLLSLEHLITL